LAALVLLVPLNHLRQLVARQMAEVYNRNVPPPPKAVQFLEAFLLKCLDIQGQPVVGVEECVLPLPLLPSLSLTPPSPHSDTSPASTKNTTIIGTGQRTSGAFPPLPSPHAVCHRMCTRHPTPLCRSNTPQAFSHWTLTYSRGKLLICDIQVRFLHPSLVPTVVDFGFCFITVFTLCRV
jgi:hypothetical protein